MIALGELVMILDRNWPGTGSRSCGTEASGEGVEVLGQGLDDVPALLFGGGDEGADDGEVTRALFGADAAGDFLPDLHHAAVAFGLVVSTTVAVFRLQFSTKTPCIIASAA